MADKKDPKILFSSTELVNPPEKEGLREEDRGSQGDQVDIVFPDGDGQGVGISPEGNGVKVCGASEEDEMDEIQGPTYICVVN